MPGQSEPRRSLRATGLKGSSGDLPGRARYLQNLLKGKIAALEEDAAKR